MAIFLSQLEKIQSYTSQYSNCSMLIIGEPNFLFTFEDLLNSKIFNIVKKDDAEVDHEITLETIKDLLRVERLETLDFDEKSSFSLDLNVIHDPVNEPYDVVWDNGVSYWLFNPRNGIHNMTQLVKNNGIIVHNFSLTGHYGFGYFNFHPRFFDDFYKINNFKFRFHGYLITSNIKNSFLNVILNLMIRTTGLRLGQLFNLESNSGKIFSRYHIFNSLSFISKKSQLKTALNVIGFYIYKKPNSQSRLKDPIIKVN